MDSGAAVDDEVGVADEPELVEGVVDLPAVSGEGEGERGVATVEPPSVEARSAPLGPEPHAAATTTDITTMATKRGLERGLGINVLQAEDAPLDACGQGSDDTALRDPTECRDDADDVPIPS